MIEFESGIYVIADKKWADMTMQEYFRYYIENDYMSFILVDLTDGVGKYQTATYGQVATRIYKMLKGELEDFWNESEFLLGALLWPMERECYSYYKNIEEKSAKWIEMRQILTVPVSCYFENIDRLKGDTYFQDTYQKLRNDINSKLREILDLEQDYEYLQDNLILGQMIVMTNNVSPVLRVECEEDFRALLLLLAVEPLMSEHE